MKSSILPHSRSNYASLVQIWWPSLKIWKHEKVQKFWKKIMVFRWNLQSYHTLAQNLFNRRWFWTFTQNPRWNFRVVASHLDRVLWWRKVDYAPHKLREIKHYCTFYAHISIFSHISHSYSHITLLRSEKNKWLTKLRNNSWILLVRYYLSSNEIAVYPRETHLPRDN